MFMFCLFFFFLSCYQDKITPKLFDSDQVIIFVVSNALQERQEIHKALSCVPTRMCLVFLIYSHRRDREGQEERREEMIQALSLYDYMDRMWYADTFYYSKSQKSLEKVKEWMYLSSLPGNTSAETKNPFTLPISVVDDERILLDTPFRRICLTLTSLYCIYYLQRGTILLNLHERDY